MPINEFIVQANRILEKMQQSPSLENGMEFAKLILNQIDPNSCTLDIAGVTDKGVVDVVGLGNTKMESWFKPHPYLGGHLSAFELYENIEKTFEVKFYHLNENATKRIIAGSVQLLPNWEDDALLTRNADWKVGIDFFLSSDARSLTFVLSLEGNLRLLEFSDRLTSTQAQIIEKMTNASRLVDQASIHGNLWNALAIREVNREFYSGVAELFEELLQKLKSHNRPIEDSKIFASRLLGRLLFAWFLRRKGLIAADSYFQTSEMDSNEYYETKLKTLFFKVLSTPVKYREIGLDSSTPYLNGGLFEAHVNDWVKEEIAFPNKYFERVFLHFERFNFTTDESSPDYEQIAIDPEMLGRVFESLLATQLTESGDSARKAKGAFYTPREIVSFMCKESLRYYLYTKLANQSLNDGVDKLIDSSDAQVAKAHSNFIRDLWGKDNAKIIIPQIIEAIYRIRIIDPACGSGAFPLGMVQVLTRTLERLDSKFDAHQAKLQLIQNCIFGIDIEPMAIEIAKLRTWLALIVEIESDDQVEPLPNLDFKYVCANSLISLTRAHDGLDFGVDQNLDQKFAEIRSRYFRTNEIKEKNDLKSAYFELSRGEYAADIDKRTKQLRSFNPFNGTVPASYFDPQQMFGISSFDVVIGNPPYLGEKNHKEIFKELRNSSIFDRFYEGRADLFHYFFHLGIDLLHENGSLAFITTNYFPTATYGVNLRNDFYERTQILQIVNFQETKLFESALGQHNMITVLRKSSKKNSYKCDQTLVNSKGVLNQNELFQILSKVSSEITTGSIDKEDLFAELPKRYLRFISSDGIDSILSKVSNSEFSLGKLVAINQGVISGIDRFTNSWRLKYPKIKAELGEPVYIFEKEKSKLTHLRPWYKSSDLDRYVVAKEPRYEILWLGRGYPKPTKAEIGHLSRFEKILRARRGFSGPKKPWYELYWPREEEIFLGEKIVNSYRTYNNNFAFHEGEFFGGADLTFITKRDGGNIDLFFVLGLLNSDLLYTWFYLRGKRKGEALELKQVPVSEVPLTRSPSVEKLIAQKAKKIYTILLKDINADVRSIQREIDEYVYKLYGLSLEEKAIIQQFVDSKVQIRNLISEESDTDFEG